MELLSQYGLFLAKIATVVVAIAVVAVLIANLTQRKRQRGELRITRLSERPAGPVIALGPRLRGLCGGPVTPE